MSLIANKKKEAAGTTAVYALRLKRLNSGHPFMINSKELPGKQCYLEYPNGDIKLAVVAEGKRDFSILRELSAEETHDLRVKYDLT